MKTIKKPCFTGRASTGQKELGGQPLHSSLHNFTAKPDGVKRPQPRRNELVHISHIIEDWLEDFERRVK